jgi:AraC-like DNA-binding protein/mannose-6-phosphate isomerase-like protein (cupin superfamily)
MAQKVNHEFREGDDFSPIPLISIHTLIDTTFLPDHIMQVHTHDDLWQLWTILWGRATIFFQGRSIEATPGALFLIGPGILHAIQTTGFTPCRILDIKWAFTEELPDSLKIEPEAVYVEQDKDISDIVDSIVTELKERRTGWGAIIKNNLFELYTSIIRIAKENEVSSQERTDQIELEKEGSLYHELIAQKAKNFIVDNFNKSISAKDVAESVSMSTRHISTIFNQYIGCSIPQFITKIRMKKATELLSNYTVPISDVCEQIGYTDQSYFSNVFKKTYGVSPSEFRNSFGLD